MPASRRSVVNALVNWRNLPHSTPNMRDKDNIVLNNPTIPYFSDKMAAYAQRHNTVLQHTDIRIFAPFFCTP